MGGLWSTPRDYYFCQICGQHVTLEGKHTGDRKSCDGCAKKVREKAVSLQCNICQRSVNIFPNRGQEVPKGPVRCPECAKVTREKFHRGELQIVQVAVSNEKTLTITYPPTEREVLQMSLRNIGAGPAIANHEDGADY